MKKILSLLLSVILFMSVIPVSKASAAVYTPEEYTLPAGGTLDVSTLKLNTLRPVIYKLDKPGATYTITGETIGDTCLRIVISADCTVILDSATITAGISYDDGTDKHYSGGTKSHGVFEIGEGKSVEFRMNGTNIVNVKTYYGVSEPLIGILMGYKAKVTFSGTGSLDIGGRIGQKIYKDAGGNPIWSGMKSYVEMKSGQVIVNGLGNSNSSVDFYLPADAIDFKYYGGSFRNIRDDNSSSSQKTTSKAASGMIYRVEIPLSGSGYIKSGADGELAFWSSDDKLYAYQSDSSVKDYYVICNGKYYHYRSGSYGNDTTATATEVNDTTLTGGFNGSLSVQGEAASDVKMTFVRDNTDGISFTGTCTTDSNGRYNVTLVPGTYTVKMEIVSGNEITYKDKFTLSTETPVTRDINVMAIRGKVTDSDNNPLGSVIVSVTQGSISYSCKTDSEGNYAIVPFDFTETSFLAKTEKLGVQPAEASLTWNKTDGITWNPKIDTSSQSRIIYVSNESDLVTLANQADQLDGMTVELTSDIELKGSFKGITLPNKGRYARTTVTFNGNNHVISNLTMPLFIGDRDSLLGGNVSDLHLQGNIDNYEATNYLGSLASYVDSCTIDNCSFTGSIKSDKKDIVMGGLIGYAIGSTIKNSYVNLDIIKNTKNAGMGGIVGGVDENIDICNSYARIKDISNNNSGSNYVNGIGGIVAYSYTYKSDSACVNVKNCYAIIDNNTGTKKPYQISGQHISNAANKISFANNYSCGGTSVFASPWGDTQATDISSDVVKSQPGTSINGQKALVDCLNEYVNNNTGNGYRSWVLGADGYPELASLKSLSVKDVTAVYDGSSHSIELDGVPEGAVVSYSVDDINYGPDKPSITDAGSKTVYYKVTFSDETKSGSAKVTVTPAAIGISWGQTEFIYDGSLKIPHAAATGTSDRDSVSLTVGHTSGNATDAGSYVARVTGITGTGAGNYKLPADITRPYNINKADKAAPVGLTSQAETIRGKGDGVISNVTTDMEYRKDGETGYSPVLSDRIDNLEPGRYFVRIKTTANYNASADAEITVERGTGQLHIVVPEGREGYTVLTDRQYSDYHGVAVLTFILSDGYSKTDDFAVTVNGIKVMLDNDGRYTIPDITTDTVIEVRGVKDITAPAGTISVDNDMWDRFSDTIIFDNFYKDTRSVQITSSDNGSGVDTVSYYVSDKAMSAEEVRNITDWTEYTLPFNISPYNNYVIYAKLTDNAGNTAYISSEGIVIYSDAKVVTKSITYTKTTNKDMTAEIQLNGNKIREVSNGENILAGGADYTISEDGSEITINGTYLQSLAAGDYELRVTYISPEDNYISRNVNNDGSTTILLHIEKAQGSITGVSDISKQFDGNSVANPAFNATNNIAADSVKLEYKLKGADDSTYTAIAPAAPGEYIVRITVNADDNYEEAVITKEFKITPKPAAGNTGDRPSDNGSGSRPSDNDPAAGDVNDALYRFELLLACVAVLAVIPMKNRRTKKIN